MSVRAFYYNSVTQISFSPIHSLSLCFTGPNARLDYRKIVPGQFELETQPESKFDEIKEAIGDEAITCHAWSSDGLFFGICTEFGQVIVYKRGYDIVL